MKLKVVILAAGQGTRMKSRLPKVLHQVAGLPMVEHVVRLSHEVGDKRPALVIGHGAESVEKALAHLNVDFVYQKEQLGTAHAVTMAKEFIQRDDSVLILYGDTPLIKPDTLRDFIKAYETSSAKLSVLTMRMVDPTGYGRIVREDGKLSRIVEHKDASEAQREIAEVNSGIYLIDGAHLLEHLGQIDSDNTQNEYYLTDIVEIFSSQGYNIDAYLTDEPLEMMGINDRIQLATAEAVMRKRINENLMREGVTIIDTQNTYIGADVVVGMDTVIHPGTILRGKTVVGENCIIGPRAVLENAIISNEVYIRESQILNSKVGEATTIGPYAYVRPGSDIGKHVKIGDYVEIKNANIGDGTKISHLTYVGDADVGKAVNLGCGVVFVNYDGVNKHRTTVGDRVFIGCNVNLIAPVTVQSDSYVAAGTTITKEVPSDSLAIGREKQRNIDGWVSRKREKR
jgi:bifunctional UDP-N-acetylglucosamine pyrophosphorylase/glucosamine-1-phosphate N-acetyltransferase